MSEDLSDNSKLLLGEIIKGKSVLRSGGEKAYLKHLTISEQINLEDFEEESYEDAIVAGIKSESELLKRAEDYGQWSNEDDNEIKACRFIIEKTQSNLEKTKDIGARKILDQTLKKANEDLSLLEIKRSKILSYSAESLASSKKIKKMLEVSLFEDSKCETPLKEELLESFSYSFSAKISDLYNHETMLKVAYEDLFFEVFCYQYRNPLLIFGGEYKNITVYQHKIISYANVLLNKLRNSDVPKNKIKNAVDVFNHKDEDKKEVKVERDGVSDLLKGKKEGDAIAISDI